MCIRDSVNGSTIFSIVKDKDKIKIKSVLDAGNPSSIIFSEKCGTVMEDMECSLAVWISVSEM